MAYPVVNSPFLPSVADAPFLPPKLREMPIFNPGVHTYRCEDGSIRTMTEEEAINVGMSCKAMRGMGQASPAGGVGSQGAPSPASPPQPTADWAGVRLVSPLLYPAAPAGTVCDWEKDSEGNDIYVCRPKKSEVRGPILYSYGPVSYPTQVVFPGLFY